MNYKIAGAIKKNRANFIICLILWVIISIVFVAPFSYAMYCANNEGVFFSVLGEYISNPFGALSNIFSVGAQNIYFKNLGVVTILYLIFFFIGFFKSAPKNQYTDIEHGSSDWSQHGEQYGILSNKEGILLAEDNYLPVDKRGNVNVLVVGRFRLW